MNIKKKTGIMGGTFNPIHTGHILLAECAFRQLNLNRVLFMPTKNPPHKQHVAIASEIHRKTMISLAIAGYSYFELSTLELDRKGITYTADTLKYLTEYAQDEFYFIIGADSLFQIETWKQPETIFRLVHVAVSSRNHLEEEKIKRQIIYLRQKYNADIAWISMPAVDISSKRIRQLLKDGKSIIEYVPCKIVDYINENKLYSN